MWRSCLSPSLAASRATSKALLLRPSAALLVVSQVRVSHAVRPCAAAPIARSHATLSRASASASACSIARALSCPNPHYTLHLARLHTHTPNNANTPTAPVAESAAAADDAPTVAAASGRAPRRTTAATARADFLAALKRRFPTLFPKLVAWARLVKLELSFVASMSAAFGYLLAGSSAFSVPHVVATFVGTIACASSAAIANQMIEVRHDARMARTAKRPLVTGELSMRQAGAAFVAGLAVGAPALLYAAEGSWAAPLIGLGTVASYAGLYTPLKRVTRFNTEFGALVGSLPVWVGWTSAVGHWAHGVKQQAAMAAAQGLDAASIAPVSVVETLLLPHALYGFLFQVAWQMSHFMTLAFLYQEQYAGADYRMMSGVSAMRKGLAWTFVLCGMPGLAVAAGVTSPMLLVTATPINLFLLRSYWRWRTAIKSGDDIASKKAARKCLRDGILYFFLMFSAILFHALDSPHHSMIAVVPDKIKEVGAALCPHLRNKQAAENEIAAKEHRVPVDVIAAQSQPAAATAGDSSEQTWRPLLRGSITECVWWPWHQKQAEHKEATAHAHAVADIATANAAAANTKA